MSMRHESRKTLLQTMYEIDMKGEMFLGLDIFKIVLDRNIKENKETGLDQEFTQSLGVMVQERLLTLDEIIKKAAPEWPIEKINVVDRNVLRMGLCELLFGDKINVPPKVAIDEAIEIAKEFGGDTSGKFVNGVLGAVYRELGEPDKDSKKKDNNFEIKVKSKSGALVFTHKDNNIYLALMLDIFGYWTMPKGSQESGELAQDCAKREILEQLGLEVKILELIGSDEYIAHSPEIGKTKKLVSYFLASSEYKNITLGNSKGILKAEWHKIKDIEGLKMYKDQKDIIKNSIGKIKNPILS